MRNSQILSEKQNADKIICETLAKNKIIDEAEMIAAYFAMSDEVDLSYFFAKLAKNKRLCFPRNIDNEYEMAEISIEALNNKKFNAVPFKKGKFDIIEPDETCKKVDVEKIDVWIIPAVGFDKNGNRLGRGNGFYDRLLKNSTGTKIGIGYDFILVDEIPEESHDQQMNLIITEKQIINTLN